MQRPTMAESAWRYRSESCAVRCASQVPSLFGSRLVEVETTDASASLPGFPTTECLNGGRPANCGGDLGKEPRPFVGGLRESDVSPERDLRMNCRPWRRSRSSSVISAIKRLTMGRELP